MRSQSLQLEGVLGIDQPRRPFRWQSYRQGVKRKHRGSSSTTAFDSIAGTRPAPVRRASRELRPNRIPFNVATHREQVVVVLHRRALETPLVEVSTTDGV